MSERVSKLGRFLSGKAVPVPDRIAEAAGTEQDTDALVDNAAAELLYKKLNGLT